MVTASWRVAAVSGSAGCKDAGVAPTSAAVVKDPSGVPLQLLSDRSTTWRYFGGDDQPLAVVVVRVELVRSIQLPFDEASNLQQQFDL